jgi:divinyl protochlorophyllide a 8-vinyl-reductase
MGQMARIGPNAILQHVPVLDAEIGVALRGALFHRAGVALPPPNSGMIPQDDVIHFHRALRLYLPGRVQDVQRAAGRGTADYILANRIPRAAQWLIRHLPSALGARLLAAAIAKHAWTFAGSGAFRVVSHKPLTFEIADNPLAQGPAVDGPVCDWHAAVFQRLFQALVWPQARVVEESCIALGDPVCRFVIHRR